ncbi:MAG: AAA family ATPase [Halodesulfovibrio sp.]
MIIRDFTMDGFGIFAGQNVSGLPDGISIFLGNNEAGKTTCLRFFRHILFGYPTPSHREFTPALRGGTPGGSLLLHTGSHGLLRMERRPGVRGGPVSLHRDSGEPLDAEILHTLLGGVTKEVYESVYGFSLTELQELASLNGDKVRHALYGASFGAATKPVGQVLKSLDAAMENLYKFSGQKPLMNRKLAELEDTLRQIRECDNAVQAYEATVALRDAMTNDLASLQHRQAGQLAERNAIERRLSLWEQGERLQQLRTQLATIAPVIDNFPDEGVLRLDRLREAIADRRAEQQNATLKIARLEERRQQLAIPTHQTVISHQSAITALAEEKGRYRSLAEQIGAAARDISGTQAALQRTLEALGNGWDADRLRTFDRSLFTQERIEQFADAIQLADTGLAHAREQHEVRKRELEKAQTDRDNAKANLARLCGQEAMADPALVEELATRREHVRRILNDLPRRRQAHSQTEQELDSDIVRLVPHWHREHILALDTSFTAREAVAAAARTLADSERALHDATVLHQSAAAQLERHDERLAGRQAEIRQHAAPTREEAEARKTALRSLRGLLRDVAEARHRLESLRTQQSARHASRPAPALLAAGYSIMALVFAAGCALSVVSANLAQLPQTIAMHIPQVPLYAAAGLVFVSLCGAALLYLRARSGAPDAALQMQIEQAEAKLHGLSDQVQAQCVAAGAASPEPADIERAELAADAMRDAAENHHRLLRSLEELRQERERLARQLAETTRTMDSTRNECDLARQNWSVRLRDQQQPATATPEVALSIFDRVEGIRARLQGLETAMQETAAMRATVYSYLALAKGLCPENVSPPEDELLALADHAVDNARRQRETATEQARAAQTLAERDTQAKQCLAAVETARQREEAAGNTRNTLATEWREWLAARGLASTLSPATALIALRHVGEGVHLLDTLEQQIRHQTVLQREAEAYAERQDALLVATQAALNLSGLQDQLKSHVEDGDQAGSGNTLADRLAATDRLSQALAAAREALAEHAALERELPELHAALQSCQERLRTLEAEHLELLRHGGAQPAHDAPEAFSEAEEHFRQRGAAYAARAAVLNEMTPLQASLEAALAAGTARADADSTHDSAEGQTSPALLLEAFLAEPLSGDAKAELTARLQTLESALTDDRKQENELRQQISDSNTALKNLATAEQMSELRSREAAIREDLHQLSRQWARHAMARQLVLSAKRTFEQQRQPAVIRHASGFFRTITGGAYSGLHTSLEDDSIRALLPGGESRLPDQLSRGTREQLFLALRLGFILSHSAGAEALPVIMDDILVNFDPGRAMLTAQALAELAEHNQILFFTCHPQTADTLLATAPSAALYRVADGTITAERTDSRRGTAVVASPA